MSGRVKVSELAINGGPKTRETPWEPRRLLGPEEKQAVDALFDAAISSGGAIGYGGAEEAAYVDEFKATLGGGFADAVSSGTTALYVALRALDPEPFTEVIVPAITDPGGMMPVPLLNCIPVVADTAPGSYNIGPEQVKAVLTPLTSAIVVAHIGGEPADIRGILALAAERGLPVVEDVAQSPGATLDGRPLGTWGRVSSFSTMFGKHFCTGGQGGMVFTREADIYARVRQASDRGKPFGLTQPNGNCLASLNFNIGELGAAIGRVQLAKLPGIVSRRRALVAMLSRGFEHLESIVIPPQLAGAEASYWFWRLEVNEERLTCDKDTFCAAVAAEGVSLNPCYRAMPHTYDWFIRRQVFGQSGMPWTSPLYRGDPDRQFPCPNAVEATSKQFNLTVFETWGETEVADILAAFSKVESAYLK